MRLALMAGAIAALIAAFAACGGDDKSNDPRVDQIGGAAELATYAYAAAGAQGLYDYLAPEVTQRCSKEQLAQALAGNPQPTGFRGMDGVKFDGDRATATVIQIFRDHEDKVEWVFVSTAQDTWRIVGLPGLDKCGST